MKTRRGFTLIEIMVVVLIIGILLAIAVPNFIRSRSRSRLQSILANLHTIDSAVQQWGIAANQPQGAVVAQSDLDGTGGTAAYITQWPNGPVTGTYAVSALGTNATFNGGNKGALDVTGWTAACSNDPASCGI